MQAVRTACKENICTVEDWEQANIWIACFYMYIHEEQIAYILFSWKVKEADKQLHTDFGKGTNSTCAVRCDPSKRMLTNRNQ